MSIAQTEAGTPSSSKLPLGVQADGTLTRKAVPIAFVLGTLAVLAALPLGVLAIILNNMGLERVQTRPETARKLVAWSWGIFAVVDGIALLALLAVILA